MTQPQQPFGENSDADSTVAMADNAIHLWRGGPMRDLCEPVDAAEMLKRQAAQIGALQVRVGVQDARIAALDDECRRLRADVERLGKAQAI